MANTKIVLTDADQALIREAVRQAEQKTSGEIVPYIVQQSDDYDVAAWRGAAIGVVKGSLLCWLLFWIWGDAWALEWLHTDWGIPSVMLIFGVLGFLLTEYIPFFKRLLTGYWQLNKRVHQRALEAFLSEEVFNTRDRTGILLFISLFEHRIEVLGDNGINARVTANDWVEVVKIIKNGIKEQNFTSGLVNAIGLCGELLHRKEVSIKTDDTNELGDNIRIREN